MRRLGDTTIYDIPQEIIDRVIGNLVRDQRSLQAASLTHRSWTPASQMFMHYHRHFDFDTGGGREKIGMYSGNAAARHVRELDLVMPYAPSEDGDTWEILSQFTGLLTLKLEVLEWPYCSPHIRDTLQAVFPNVRTLSLGTTTFRHAEDFLFFLSAFPSLSDLEMMDCSVYIPNNEPAPDGFPRQTLSSPPGSRLTNLSLKWTGFGSEDDYGPSALVAPWISLFPKTVKPGLKVKWSGVGFDTFPEYLHAMGPVITELELHAMDVESVPERVGMAHCIGLKSLTFGSLCTSDGMPPENSLNTYSWVISALEEVTSSSLETIVFKVGEYLDIYPDTLDFTAVAWALTRPVFKNVHVTLSLTSRCDVETFRLIVTKFVSLMEENRLSITRH